MLPLEFLLIVALLVGSAVMSASEAAVFSLSRFQLRALRDRFRPTYRRLRKLLGDPAGLLITILITNELFNVTIASLLAGMLDRNWYEHEGGWLGAWLARHFFTWPLWARKALVSTAVSAPIIVLICEVTPKAIGARANRLVALLTTPLLNFVYEALLPLRLVWERVSSWVRGTVVHRVGSPARADSDRREALRSEEKSALRESEIISLAEAGHEEGSIGEDELELIRNVFHLDDTPVSEVVTPMHEVFAVEAGTQLGQVVDLVKHPRYSRIPVIRRMGVTTPGLGGLRGRIEVVGVVHFKDLVFGKVSPEFRSQLVDEVMRKPLFVGPGLKLNSVFRRMKQTRSHLAVVQTQAGEGLSSALGIVTMDDILDALFEDILGASKETDNDDDTPELGA